MSTNTLEDTNPLAFMLFVDVGSVLGGILSQVLFPSEECPIEKKSTSQTQNKASENNVQETDQVIIGSNSSEIEQQK